MLRAIDAAALSLLIARRSGVDDIQTPGGRTGTTHCRRQVHQATGMLAAQLGIPMDQAFARVRAHAYAHG